MKIFFPHQSAASALAAVKCYPRLLSERLFCTVSTNNRVAAEKFSHHSVKMQLFQTNSKYLQTFRSSGQEGASQKTYK